MPCSHLVHEQGCGSASPISCPPSGVAPTPPWNSPHTTLWKHCRNRARLSKWKKMKAKSWMLTCTPRSAQAFEAGRLGRAGGGWEKQLSLARGHGLLHCPSQVSEGLCSPQPFLLLGCTSSCVLGILWQPQPRAAAGGKHQPCTNSGHCQQRLPSPVPPAASPAAELSSSHTSQPKRSHWCSQGRRDLHVHPQQAGFRSLQLSDLFPRNTELPPR